MLAEFDRLDIANYYNTVEITVPGHYQVSSIRNMINLFFVLPDIKITKPVIKVWVDAAAFASISASQRILTRNHKDWHIS